MGVPKNQQFYHKWVLLKTCNFIKKRLQNRCFYVKFAKFLGISLFTEHLGGCFCLFWNKNVKMKKYVHKNIFTGKRQWWCPFWYSCRIEGLHFTKKGLHIRYFLWNLRSFTESHFYRRQLGDGFRFPATFRMYHLLY